ncbi:chalcone isomerase family protein [Massilia sp. R798]|uniref:Chalcone isomerase family protein n=2 Tax=Massilia soli TaxID=2792854 RepID=A0ABS7SSB4_9BURK|nr:chalcone isomerase family protein [Massilia soli]
MARLLLVALMSTVFASAAQAAMPQVAPDLPGARVSGQGKFTWFGMKIYDASLWVGEAGYAPGAPFALELRYARALSGVRIADASADQMEKTGGGTKAQRALWLGKMRAIFPDVKEGSRITGVFLPGGAVRFHLDEAVLGTISEPGFAQAFAGIWLSPRTTAPQLREALLKEAARQ